MKGSKILTKMENNNTKLTCKERLFRKQLSFGEAKLFLVCLAQAFDLKCLYMGIFVPYFRY